MVDVEVLIAGGGITGMSAAWTAQQAGVRYALLEASDRWGGKLHTETVDLPEGPVQVEAGPESFISRKPEVWDLAHALGLAEAIVPLSSGASQMQVLHQGRAYRVPLGPGAFLSSGLLSLRGKLRLLGEPFVPPRRDDDDETLAAFARRRLGSEAAQRMVEPILGGIYNTDPTQQSVMFSAPQMRAMEKAHGSLIRGAVAAMRRKPAGPKKPRFFSFKGGTRTLVTSLLQQLTGDLRLNARVESLAAIPGGYRVALADGRTITAAALVLALPPHAAAPLLQTLTPDAAEDLADLPGSSVGTISLIYRAADLANLGTITGLMIPRPEGRRIDAVLNSTQRTPGSLPDAYAMLKVFFGGGDPSLLGLTGSDILDVVQTELEDLLKVTATPLSWRIYRWPSDYPLARVGHLAQVDAIEAQLPTTIRLAGGHYRGLGVPDCVRQGSDAVRHVLASSHNAVPQMA